MPSQYYATRSTGPTELGQVVAMFDLGCSDADDDMENLSTTPSQDYATCSMNRGGLGQLVAVDLRCSEAL